MSILPNKKETQVWVSFFVLKPQVLTWGILNLILKIELLQCI
ncbi:MAG: hypothetical protein RLZ91_1334 [Bacteroidota bacterium]